MEITINVPEMTCAKCNATAPVQPVFLYVKSAIPPQFRDALTDVVKERADVHAIDDRGRAWEAFADYKPVGWTKGPGEADLCATCTVLWAEAGRVFMVPPPVAPQEDDPGLEGETLPPPPTKDQDTRPPTMSEIVAARNYESSAPNNSLMPMAPPSSLRR